METVSEIKISYQPGTAEQQNPIVTNPREAFKVLYPHFDPETLHLQEQMLVLYLNRRNRVRGVYNGFRGGITSSLSDIRIILGIALKGGCTGIIMAHNHPSGNPQPSEADIRMTGSIKKACEMMELTLVDHLIITPDKNYYSFSEEGKL